MSNKTYLDKYKTPEEKTAALIDNLFSLIKYKGFTVKEVEQKITKKKQYLSQCKHYNRIEFSVLLSACEFLGVSLNHLMSFSYENVAKKAEIDAKKKRLQELTSEMNKLKMQIDLDEKALNTAYANWQKGQ